MAYAAFSMRTSQLVGRSVPPSAHTSACKIINMVLKSDFEDVVIPTEPLHEYFGRLWSRHPQRTALIDSLTSEKLNYAQFLAHVKKISGCLQADGVESQMRVQYFLNDSITAFCIMKALMFANATIVLCRPDEQMKTSEYVHQLLDSEVEYILCDPETLCIVEETFKEHPGIAKPRIIFVGDREKLETHSGNLDFKFFDDLLKTDAVWSTPECGSAAEDIAIIAYTSGTTSKPKGAMHPVKSFTGQSEMILRGSTVFQDGDVYLLGGSLFYSCEIIFSQAVLNVGGTVVLARQGRNLHLKFVEVVERHNVTVGALTEVRGRAVIAKAPQFPRYREQVKSLRLMIYIGSILRPGFAKLMSNFFNCGFTNNYGMTETFAISFSENTRDAVCGAGRPLPNVSIKVVDQSSRKEVPDGTVGELMLRSDSLMVGYLNGSEESRIIEADGWLRTGDLGYIDADERSIYLVDRCKEVIICMDENLSPGELEEILREHEAVEQAVVFGIPHQEYVEVPTALVTVRDGFRADAALAEELKARVRKSTSRHKHLYGGVYFCSWNQVPKTGSGKISRLKSRDKFLGGEMDCRCYPE